MEGKDRVKKGTESQPPEIPKQEMKLSWQKAGCMQVQSHLAAESKDSVKPVIITVVWMVESL